jgi:hypothetical protein
MSSVAWVPAPTLAGAGRGPVRGPWLVSRAWDLAVFGGPALAAFALLAWGRLNGVLDSALPPWLWVVSVVGVDVAHVWATAFRVYLDPRECQRRPGLYLGVPLVCLTAGVLAYGYSSQLFWRLLAYAAVVHFVRQQYGWVALYRHRLGRSTRLDLWLDAAAIYAATLYPLLWWHAHLPREFEWFVAGDFIPGLPAWLLDLLGPLHVAALLGYALRQGFLLWRGQPVSLGKNLIVTTTWATWYVGIVVFDSDYVFTVTNVLTHGVPYLALLWLYGRSRWRAAQPATHGATRVLEHALTWLFKPGRWPLYVGVLVCVALAEEWLWDRAVWHEHAALLPGPTWFPGTDTLGLLVPLLALPQATHYVLDAWIWRLRDGTNPDLGRHLGL